MNYIDLHTHTKLSDGALTPAELITKAKEVGLSAIAVTDHDLVDGLDEARGVGKKLDVEVIPGIEMTVYNGETQYHMLGYYFDYSDPKYNETLRFIQNGRSERAKQQVALLNEIGFTLTYEDVVSYSTGTVVLPHVAMAMIKNPANHQRLLKEFGKEPETGDVIEAYLAEGKPAYVRKPGFSPQEAISEIHRLGGLVSLAHPGWGMADISDPTQITFQDEDIDMLAGLGLDAIEVYAHYDDQKITEAVMNHFKKRAEDLGLLITGGSDYHGFGNAGMELGFTNFYLKVEYDVLTKMKQKLGL